MEYVPDHPIIRSIESTGYPNEYDVCDDDDFIEDAWRDE